MTRSKEDNAAMNKATSEMNQTEVDFGKNFKILLPNDQIKGKTSKHIVRSWQEVSFQYFSIFLKELQTILRDKSTSRSDFKFYADRLIRLVIEESLNQLPYSDCSVVTPTGKL